MANRFIVRRKIQKDDDIEIRGLISPTARRERLSRRRAVFAPVEERAPDTKDSMYRRLLQLGFRDPQILFDGSKSAVNMFVIEVDEQFDRIVELTLQSPIDISDLEDEGLEFTPDVPVFIPIDAALDLDRSFNPFDLWHLDHVIDPDYRSRTFTYKSEPIKIAVIDSGVALTAELTSLTNSYRVDEMSKNVVLSSETGIALDPIGHGTLVASLIAGKDVGVSPGVEIVGYRAFDNEHPTSQGQFFAYLSEFELSLRHTIQHPQISIANVSAGLDIPGSKWTMIPEVSQSTARALQNLTDDVQAEGILVVTATGNKGADAFEAPSINEGVLSVGASNRLRQVWSRSNYGSFENELGNMRRSPDCVAPGFDVTSCDNQGYYRKANGTSLSAPIASGIAAHILAESEEMTTDQLKKEVLSRCVEIEATLPSDGFGLVQYGTPPFVGV